MGAAGCRLRGLPASQNTSILTRVWLDVIDSYYRLMRMGTLKTTCGDQGHVQTPLKIELFLSSEQQWLTESLRVPGQ